MGFDWKLWMGITWNLKPLVEKVEGFYENNDEKN